MARPLAIVFLMAAAAGGLAHALSPPIDLCDYEYLLPPGTLPADAPVGTDAANAILRAHNLARRDVTPYAKAMPMLKWDPKLANMSQAFVSQCRGYTVSPYEERIDTLGYGYIGQSIAAGPTATFGPGVAGAQSAVSQLLSERANFTYPYVCAGGADDCTRYSQMIWAGTSHVGCGVANCGANTYWACSYGEGGNIRGGEDLEVAFPPYASSATVAGADRCSSAHGTQLPPTGQETPSGDPSAQTKDGCDESYLLQTNEPSPTPGLTVAAINEMLLIHNKARRNVVPYAETMPMLRWNSDLASFSQDYANGCPSDRSPAAGRHDVLGSYYVGQSVATGHAATFTARSGLEQFLAESSRWSHPRSCSGGADCSRYMQMIWAETTEVGCAMATCGSKASLVCSYGVGGNLPNNYNTSRSFIPYTPALTLAASDQCTAMRGIVYPPDACDYEFLLPPGALVPTADAPLDTAAANTILMLHNNARRAVHPYAKTMPLLRWDPKLANMSQAYVSQCPGFAVSPYEDRIGALGFTYVGQSIAAGPNATYTGAGGASAAVQEMLREREDWSYPQDCAAGRECTRYTQVIWADTTRVGCGFHTCGDETYWVCSYGEGGNIRGGEDLEVGFPPYPTAPDLASAERCSADNGFQEIPDPKPDVPHPSEQAWDACDYAYLAPLRNVANSTLSVFQMADILVDLNKARRNVSPYAMEMPMLQWSSELAQMSQPYADTCPTAPQDAADRPQLDGRVTGQVVVELASSLHGEQWAMWEGEAWSYPFNCDAGADCSRYMQVIWAKATEVGCALSVNSSCADPVLVCSFNVPPNVPTNATPGVDFDESFRPYKFANSLANASKCTAANGFQSMGDSCTATYALPPGYIPETNPVNTAIANVILTAHNLARRAVYPLAQEMPMLTWDQTLADYSQEYADKCKGYKVSPYEERMDPERFGVWYVGQSIMQVKDLPRPTLAQAAAGVQEMLAGQIDWTFPQTCGNGTTYSGACTRYTQMIWAETTRVGCGYSECSESGIMAGYYVCSYAVGGNIRSGDDLADAYDPYTIADGLNNSATCSIGRGQRPFPAAIADPPAIAHPDDCDWAFLIPDNVPSPSSAYSREEVNAILTAHNDARRAVHPYAAEMPMLTWDEELAAYSRHYGLSCPYEPRSTAERSSAGLAGVEFVGQSVVFGNFSSPTADALAQMVSGRASFTYPFTCAAGEDCSHYMQMIWAESTRVGCSTNTACGDGARFVCSYAEGANLPGHYNASRSPLPYVAALTFADSARCTADRGSVFIDDACDALYLLPPSALPADAAVPTDVANELLRGQNRARRSVQPYAIEMPMLAWDEELASFSQGHAAQCLGTAISSLEERTNYTRFGAAVVGQSIVVTEAEGVVGAADAVRRLLAGQQNFTYPNACEAGADCAMYTQAVWAYTTRVGCGFQRCGGNATAGIEAGGYWVCSYAVSGNVPAGAAPYRSTTLLGSSAACTTGRGPVAVAPAIPPPPMGAAADSCDYSYLMPDGALPADSPVTTAEANLILRMSNEARRGVVPAAARMPMLHWDEGLAAYSADYLDQCPGVVVSDAAARLNVTIGGTTYAYLGQSIASGATADFSGEIGAVRAMEQILAEGSDWSYPADCAPGKLCMRYSQTIWADTTLVGCAFKACGTTVTGPPAAYWLCTYSVGGNIYDGAGAPIPPYTSASGAADAAPCSNANLPSIIPIAPVPPADQPLDACDAQYLLTNATNIDESFLTLEQANEALTVHNRARRNVDPMAADMPMLRWNERLAEMASAYAATCPSGGRSPAANRTNVGGFAYVGQSVVAGAAAATNLTTALAQMVGEEASWSFPFNCAPGADCSRYMQMIWAETTEVGCSTATCGAEFYMVCAYGVGGNLPNNYDLGRSFLPYIPVAAVIDSAECSAQRGFVYGECEKYILPNGTLEAIGASLTTEQANGILEAHNDARRDVYPYAKAMPMLSWNNTLAAYSQEYISTCPGFLVSDPSERVDPERFGVWYVGQSIAAGPIDTFGAADGWKLAMAQMMDEKANFEYPSECAAGKDCSRYKQMIWAATTEVGCGFATCGSTPTGPPAAYWVCSYAVGGNMVANGPDGSFLHVYEPYQSTANLSEAGPCQNDVPPPPTRTPTTTTDETTTTGAATTGSSGTATPSSTPGHTDCPTCPPRPSCPTCVIPTLPPCPPGGCTLFPTCPSGNCNIPCTGPFCWNSNTTCILGWCTSDGINYWSNSAPSAAPSTAGALLAALGLAAIVAQLLA